jgi:hypothetical protein
LTAGWRGEGFSGCGEGIRVGDNGW